MKYDKQIQAKTLRLQGKSINYIAKELGVSTSSVCAWVKDIQLSDEQKQELQQSKYSHFREHYNDDKKSLALSKRKNNQLIGRETAKKKDTLHCMGCMLFWAEGSKKKNQIVFTNSDNYMMKLFVRFLKEKFDIKNEEISLHINCYLNTQDDIKNNITYWVNELDLSGCKIAKPTIKITTNNIENFGVCRITVCNTQIVQQIYGAIQEYAGFDNSLGLENKKTRQVHCTPN